MGLTGVGPKQDVILSDFRTEMVCVVEPPWCLIHDESFLSYNPVSF